MAACRLGRAVQGVRGRAPDGIVGGGAMRLQGGLVPVGFEEVVDVLVLRVLKNIEAQTARLVTLGAEGIHLDRLEEPLALAGLHPNLHPHRQHAASFLSKSNSPGVSRSGKSLPGH